MEQGRRVSWPLFRLTLMKAGAGSVAPCGNWIRSCAVQLPGAVRCAVFGVVIVSAGLRLW